jgi:hypothetical protein
MFCPIPFWPVAAAFTCDAADFDGTNDKMARGAELDGMADSKSGIFSGWVRIDGGDGTTRRILGTQSGGGLQVFINAGNVFRALARNAALTDILGMNTPNTFTASITWLHVLMSWDLATASARSIYINDSINVVVDTFVDDTIDYTRGNWGVGDNPGINPVKWNGAMAEIYFAPGQYLDFSVEANRRKFISATGKPVDLGADGSTPTGVAPLVYLHLDDGEAVANFATNRGTGGNFTITGTLDTASSSPSD